MIQNSIWFPLPTKPNIIIKMSLFFIKFADRLAADNSSTVKAA